MIKFFRKNIIYFLLLLNIGILGYIICEYSLIDSTVRFSRNSIEKFTDFSIENTSKLSINNGDKIINYSKPIEIGKASGLIKQVYITNTYDLLFDEITTKIYEGNSDFINSIKLKIIEGENFSEVDFRSKDKIRYCLISSRYIDVYNVGDVITLKQTEVLPFDKNSDKKYKIKGFFNKDTLILDGPAGTPYLGENAIITPLQDGKFGNTSLVYTIGSDEGNREFTKISLESIGVQPKLFSVSKTLISNEESQKESLFKQIVKVVLSFTLSLNAIIYTISMILKDDKKTLALKKSIGYRNSQIMAEYSIKYIAGMTIFYVIGIVSMLAFNFFASNKNKVILLMVNNKMSIILMGSILIFLFIVTFFIIYSKLHNLKVDEVMKG